jgi:hypothetical protein
VKPIVTDEQRAHYEQMMDKIAAKAGHLRTDPAVQKLVPELVGRVMAELVEGEGTLEPAGAFMALGMAMNAIATILAGTTDPAEIEASKKAAGEIIHFAMHQTMIVREAKSPAEVFMRKAPPETKH